MTEFSTFTLPNDLRIVFKQTGGDAAHCGMILNAGTREEHLHEQGLAHFIEHTLFKGTKKRNFYHILSRIDSVGGELNAYTAKEETCIHASFQKQYLERAIELIADITFNSTFPVKEMEKEKDIIIDEIHSYRDTPAEQIYDDFEMHLFKQHPLGNNILGTVESVKSFKQKHITDFIKRNYLISNMVFGVAGNYSKEQVKKLIEKHFGHYATKGQIPARKAPAKQKAFHIVNKINTNQSHCIIGSLAPSAPSRKRTGMVLLNNLLGGPGMNSRLNLNIREKYGFAYNLDSSYVAYSDTGLFAVYLGTDKKYLQKTTELVYKELKKLREAPIGALQLHKAKQQLCGNIALAQENNSNVMLALSKSMLMFNKIDSLHAIYNEIEQITAQQLFNLANEVFEEKKLSTLTFE